MFSNHQIPRVLVVLSTVQKACRDKLTGILRYAHLHGPWDIQMLEEHPHIVQLEAFKNWQPDGVIFDLSAKKTKPDIIAQHIITQQRIPSVLLDGVVSGRQPAVRHDSRLIAETAADHLIQLGLEHFAFIRSVPDVSWSNTRAEAFGARLAAAGHVCHFYTPDHAEDWGLEQQHMRMWLEALPKPCGIMVAHDLRAKQVLDTCLAAGICVPDEIAVVGVDNDLTICENTTPTLSSVLPDFEGGGYLAAGLLADLLQGVRGKPRQLTYGVHGVIQRRSSMYLKQSGQFIVSAMEFIRLNACAGITVPDVADHLRVSRRYAERHFRAALNRSILSEIQARQLERVCTLLRETNQPIGEIGHSCGYDSETYLKTLFKRRFGMTMREYRKRERL